MSVCCEWVRKYVEIEESGDNKNFNYDFLERPEHREG